MVERKYPEEVKKIEGVVYYVGCSNDLSDLFLFPFASTHIHQDLSFINTNKKLKSLAKRKKISRLEFLSDDGFRREIHFIFGDKRKILIEYYGKSADIPKQKSDIALFTPNETKKGIDILFMKAMPYPNSIKMVLINSLPYLKENSFLVDYPLRKKYNSFILENITKIGLKEICIKPRCFKKIKNLSKIEIEKILNYSLKNYLTEI